MVGALSGYQGGVAGTAVEITARRQAQDALRELNATLEPLPGVTTLLADATAALADWLPVDCMDVCGEVDRTTS